MSTTAKDEGGSSPHNNNSGSPGIASNISPTDSRLVNQQVHTETNQDVDSTTRFLGSGSSTEVTVSMAKSSNAHLAQLMDIKSFLMKPYLISSGTWTTGWTVLYTPSGWTSIGSSLTGITYWANKIQGFENIRGTAKLRLVLNANPMQQGRLKLAWYPTLSSDTGVAKYQTLCALSQLPGVEVSTADSEAILTVPFIGPYDYYNIKQGAYDWGGWGIFVLSPLQTGASGETSVSYNVFLSFEDVELVTPLVPQSGSSQLTYPKRSKFKAERGVDHITDLFESAGGLAANTVSSFLTPFISTAPWVSSFISGAAQAMGFSKPPTSAPPMIVSQAKAPFMSNSSGISTAPTLGLRHDNQLDVIDISVNGVDEMSFDYLKQVPALVDHFTLATSDNYNSNVFSSDMSIKYHSSASKFTDFTITNGGHTTTLRNFSSIGFLARYFRFARGCIRVTLKFVKTQFHTGRYIVTWTPAVSFTTSPTATTSVLSIREVIDLSGPAEVTLDLPYLLPYQWKDIVRQNSSFGQLDVICANPLRCPEVCSGTVDVLVYMSGGADFQFSGFTTVNNLGGSTVNYQPALIAQSGDIQEGESAVVVDSVVAGTVCDSSSAFEANRLTTGEVFNHLRQLYCKYQNINFNTQSYTNNTLYSDANGQAHIVPSSVFSYLPSFTTAFGFLYPSGVSLQSELTHGFSYWRGGTKLVIGSDTSSNWNTNLIGVSLSSLDNDSSYYLNYCGSGPSVSARQCTMISLTNSSVTMANLPYCANESTFLHNSNTGIAEVQVPFYSQYKLIPTVAFSNVSYLPRTGVDIRAFGATASGDFQVGLAAAEDFQVTLFVGFPAVFISYA